MAMPGAARSQLRDGVEQRRRVGGRAVSTPYAGGEAEVPGAVAVGVGMLTPSPSFQSPDGAVLQTSQSRREAAGALLELYQGSDGVLQSTVKRSVMQQGSAAVRRRDGGAQRPRGSQRSRTLETGVDGGGRDDRSSASQVSAAFSIVSIQDTIQHELNEIQRQIAELSRVSHDEARSYGGVQSGVMDAERERRPRMT